ncbi:MAG: hypothetical protein WAK20_11060, partial [Candidatus Acidiferrum sp.]
KSFSLRTSNTSPKIEVIASRTDYLGILRFVQFLSRFLSKRTTRFFGFRFSREAILIHSCQSHDGSRVNDAQASRRILIAGVNSMRSR